VFGHKPTYGICPQRGHSLVATVHPTDIAVIGPLARSAADLELALSILAGPEESDAGRAYSLHLPPATQKDFRDFRVALVTDDDFAEVDEDVRLQLTQLGSFLTAQGAKVSPDARPQFQSRELYALYMILLRSAAAASVSDEAFAQALTQAQGASRQTREVAKLNAYGVTLSHRDWLRLDEERHRYRLKWMEFFSAFDVLLCPPLSTAAFPHSDIPPQQRTLQVNQHEVPFENQLFWAGYAGAAYLPATVAPIGLTPTGLPIGVQIIGPSYADLTCLRFARLLEDHYRSFAPPPGFAD
jgi:amidase